MIINYLNRGEHLLKQLGFDEYAYIYSDIWEVLDYILNQQDIVWGGDIYIEENGKFIFQYHGWSYTSYDFKLDSEKSIQVAKNYIQKCVEWYGENFYVVLVVDKGIYKPNKIY